MKTFEIVKVALLVGLLGAVPVTVLFGGAYLIGWIWDALAGCWERGDDDGFGYCD
jgi:hypothetical protein